MAPKYRAAWGRPFKFTDADRKALAGILKRCDPVITKSYIDIVEQKILWLRVEWKTAGEVPPEPPGTARAVLKRITKHSDELHKALDELDSSGSLITFSFMLESLGRDMDSIEYFLHDLPLLSICANKASEITNAAKRGRPTDAIERRFIGNLGEKYLAMFNIKPTHSRGSVFSRFVAKVLEFALPGNPHTARDNSKIIKAALIDCGIIK